MPAPSPDAALFQAVVTFRDGKVRTVPFVKAEWHPHLVTFKSGDVDALVVLLDTVETVEIGESSP